MVSSGVDASGQGPLQGAIFSLSTLAEVKNRSPRGDTVVLLVFAPSLRRDNRTSNSSTGGDTKDAVLAA